MKVLQSEMIHGYALSCTWLPTQHHDIVRVSEEMVQRAYTYLLSINHTIISCPWKANEAVPHDLAASPHTGFS